MNDIWPAGSWVPIPQTENQFNEDVIGPTSEMVEPPAQFEYVMSYVQMGYEQPTSQILTTEEVMSHEYVGMKSNFGMTFLLGKRYARAKKSY